MRESPAMLLQASAHALPLRAGSVQTAVTSPPYWALREYQGEQGQTFGGDPEHAHVWGSALRHGRRGNRGVSGTGGNLHPTLDAAGEGAGAGSSGRFCACGAWRGHFGLEPTPELYIEHLVEALAEVARVLRPDGTLWLNLGDCYASSGGHTANGANSQRAGRSSLAAQNRGSYSQVAPGLKEKDLVGIPWRAAFAAQGFALVPAASLAEWADVLAEARGKGDWQAVAVVEERLRAHAALDALRGAGWYLRADVVWHKPNAQPESVRDRPTKAHESVFLLTRAEDYFYDADAIKEPISDAMRAAIARGPRADKQYQHDAHNRFGKRSGNRAFSDPDSLARIAEGRNARSVWSIPTQPYPGAHFATFPPALAERCILAGSPPHACGGCGTGWQRDSERIEIREGEPYETRMERLGAAPHPDYQPNRAGAQVPVRARLSASVRAVGDWRPGCACEAPARPAVVLDPFAGSGTTGMVARRHGRAFVGVDIAREYVRDHASWRVLKRAAAVEVAVVPGTKEQPQAAFL